MSDKLTVKKEINQELISQLVLQGDISKMSDEMKVTYYNQLCHSLNLNPVTRPFQMISFQGKSVLYATKDATEQLRKLNGVSVVDLSQEIKDGLCISKCKVQDSSNRYDIATGVVTISGLKGGDLANAIMKSETKAKRRATLSICGLGMLDESELDTMPKYETTDISQVKTTEPVQTSFVEKAMNYFNTLKTKPEVEKAFEDAKKRKEYLNLTEQEKADFDEFYLECIAKFIKPEDVIEVVKVEEDLSEIKRLKECTNVTDLNKAYKEITSVPTYKQYAGTYQEEIDSVYESVKSEIKGKAK